MLPPSLVLRPLRDLRGTLAAPIFCVGWEQPARRKTMCVQDAMAPFSPAWRTSWHGPRKVVGAEKNADIGILGVGNGARLSQKAEGSSGVSVVAWGSWWLHTATYGAIAVLLSGAVLLAVLFFAPYAHR